MYGGSFVDMTTNNASYGFVYCTTNNINGMKYIGQHCSNLEDDQYLGSGRNIRKAIKEFGKENFTREIIGWAANQSELDQLEIDMINKYDAVNSPNFYNIAPGGFTHAQSEETRRKISQTLTGIKRSEETRKKMSECKKRENLSPETRRKLSEAQKGRKLSPEQIEKMRKAKKGVPLSDECKRKLSEANKGKIISEETRKKISDAQKGRPGNHDQPTNIKIRCVETGEEFSSIHEADRITGIDFRSISAHLHGRVKSVGGRHFVRIE